MALKVKEEKEGDEIMKYKNVSKGILKFRGIDKKGKPKRFELKPNEEFETETEHKFGGLEEVKKKRGEV